MTFNIVAMICMAGMSPVDWDRSRASRETWPL